MSNLNDDVMGEPPFEPKFLSVHLLEHDKKILRSELKAYATLVKELQRKKRTQREQLFVDDYHDHISEINLVESYENTEIFTDVKELWNTNEPVNIKPIKLNELVLKPQSFDGRKPSPRQWIDEYERAARANGWSESSMVHYFQTFLTHSALDWFFSMGESKIGQNAGWSKVRDVFKRHYLGESDRQSIRRTIDRCYQYEDEPVARFMPRLLRLVSLIEPNKSEIDKVELVRDRLRSKYQSKLATYRIDNLESLNDICLSLESGFHAETIAKQREANEKPSAANNKQRGPEQREVRQHARPPVGKRDNSIDPAVVVYNSAALRLS